ncbi:hypothetical protein ES319_A11G048100v1 [Gossypium barbadense]|uniref:Rhodanese domain-containing protein n=2 Tax=Gossypium TaxID=3633 RepID=A0A5J5TI65_GOSBA|nr:hypothetical protein ES319_A11G048100v1 [Gossypium barbadense]TYG92664.1 hypothetical protein ES288_A11G050200v1 [Gossypium darwinii]
MGSLDLSSGSEVVTIHVNEAKNLLQSGYRYIDVRTVEEFEKGHVEAENILNIPYLFITPEGRVKNPEFLKEVSSLCKEDDPLLQPLIFLKLVLRMCTTWEEVILLGWRTGIL